MKGRAGLAVAALALVGVLALAVFPTTALLDQRRNHKALLAEEAALSTENQVLRARVDQLGTNEEIERLARQYNLVKPGEEAYFILPRPQTPAPPPAAEAPPPSRSAPSPSLWDRIKGWF